MAQAQLVTMIRERALVFGDFTLASGKKSKFYLDCRKLTLDAESINPIADGLLALCEQDWPDAVGGLELGAVPITAAMLARAGARGRSLRGFVVRKEAKDHGRGRLVEGPVEPGQRVAIVEDVATTGSSSWKAVLACREMGLHVDRVLAIVDRQEGAAALFQEHGLDFQALVTLSDLGIGPDRG